MVLSKEIYVSGYFSPVVQDAGRVGQVVSNSAGAKIVNLLDEAGTKSTILDEHKLLTTAKRCGRPPGASASEHFQQPSDSILPPPDKIPRRTDEMKTSISEVRDLYSIAKPVTPNFLTLPEMDCFQPIHPQPQDTLLLDNDWMFRKAMEQTKVLLNNSEELNRLPEQRHEEIQTLMKPLPLRDSSPWQDQPLPKPHSKKWCNFDYVMREIKLLWAVSKTVDPEKEIKAKDILALEGDLSINNYLTLIRILDKLALRKRLYLKMKKGELTIRPINPSFGSFTDDRTATDTRNFIY
ncbi:hypothetical protein RUM44_014008 [Polyplax serrata]|uniref:Uncharacterized protein n=1 Tax=Polyplax serrata TaxID=468196 RepID=A0ABR1BFP7_POLSC